MSSPQPLVSLLQSPSGGHVRVAGFGGAITTTTITVTISPVRSVVFA